MSDSWRPHGLYLACQASLSMEFSRQEYWSEYSLRQGTFLTKGLNLGHRHHRQILYRLNHQGSPDIIFFFKFKKIYFFRELLGYSPLVSILEHL